jgi:anaerobic sulfite reductase subunit C
MSYVIAKNGKLLIELISSDCDLCGCCVGVCPEDAIELTAVKLSIIPSRCTNCAKCVWSCPFEALKFNKDGVLL